MSIALKSNEPYLFLNGGRQRGEELGVDLADPQLCRLLLLLLRALLDALQPQLLGDHLLPNVLGQRRQERRVDAFRQAGWWTQEQQLHVMSNTIEMSKCVN